VPRPKLLENDISLIIFASNLTALFAGCAFAYQGYEENSSLSIIVNCVGVMFIHDLDDKLFDALHVFSKSEFESLCVCTCCNNCCAKFCFSTCCWLLFVLLFGIMVPIFGGLLLA